MFNVNCILMLYNYKFYVWFYYKIHPNILYKIIVKILKFMELHCIIMGSIIFLYKLM